MGRILEALKQAPAARRISADLSPVPPDARAVLSPIPAISPEEMPFIEVGGPGTIMEASPSVLAQPGPKTPARRQWAEVSVKAALAPVQPPETGPVSLAFHSLSSLSLAPPAERFAPELVAFHKPEHQLAGQYRTLLAGILKQLPEGQSQVLLFTSPMPSAAKTTVLLNLAITAARQDGPAVVVVDAGASPPAIAQRLGLSVAPGLREVLQGTVTLPAALQETGQAKLQALTAGGPGKGSAGAEAFKGVLRELRQSFDLVLVDARAWEGGPEVATLGSACDMAYLVLPQSDVKTAKVEELLQVIPRNGIQLGGCILTTP